MPIHKMIRAISRRTFSKKKVLHYRSMALRYYCWFFVILHAHYFALIFTLSFRPSHQQAWRCDMAVLVFDPSSRESLDYITRMQVDRELSVYVITFTAGKAFFFLLFLH